MPGKAGRQNTNGLMELTLGVGSWLFPLFFLWMIVSLMDM